MMEATVAVIFIVCFASNGAPVESDVPDQEKFQNLFDSLSKKDKQTIDINREILRERAVHERQAFDALVSGLRSHRRMKPANDLRYRRDATVNGPNPTAFGGNERSVATTSAERQTDSTSRSRKFSEETTPTLPEPNADWTSIRRMGKLYIDKTPYLRQILKRGGKLCYVTRPRRFGKSLFIQMAADYFRGKKDMFEGLAVENIGNTEFLAKYMPKTRGRLPKWKEFPVIHLDFGDIGNFSTGDQFVKAYRTLLERIAVSYQLDLSIWTSFGLGALVTSLRQKFNGLPVIILVDEYDHPFRYALLNLKKEVAEDVRSDLHGIFTTIKGNIEYLGLALMTGVSELGLPAIESSGIIAFVDLTFDEDLAQAFGLSETEITSKMGPNLRYWARNTEEKAEKPFDDPVKKIMEDLTDWYDGYQFAVVNESCRVFNPISTIQSMRSQECKNYWTSTGSLAHFVDQFYREGYTWDELKNGGSTARENLFTRIANPTVSLPPLHIWMLMFGYYTISSYDKSSKQVTLSIPNKEIEEALQYHLDMYVPSEKKFIHLDFESDLSRLKHTMSIGDTEEAMMILKRFVLYNYKHRLNKGLTFEEATRRLALVLDAAGVKVEDSIPFRRDDNPKLSGGDIDLQTVNLPVHYIFKTKCTINTEKGDENILSAIQQQIGYLEHHPINFIEANKKMSNYKIVAVNFQLIDRSISLHSWIAVPCVNGIVQFPDVLANSAKLKSRFLGNYSVKNTESEYKKIMCGPVLP